VLDADPFALRFGVPGTITAEAPVLPLAPLAGSPIPAAFAGDCLRIEVVVIVPVYGAPALVERCIESVLRHSGAHARLIVIDDASPDPAIAPLLSRYRGRSGVELLHNETNRGFTATVNRGIACAARADVVLLNADTEVGPNWLAGLRRAAYSASDIGTVTAVSDNAGAFSVPELEQYCPWPAAWSFTQASRALWQHAGLAYPRMPTGNGFCLYIPGARLGGGVRRAGNGLCLPNERPQIGVFPLFDPPVRQAERVEPAERRVAERTNLAIARQLGLLGRVGLGQRQLRIGLHVADFGVHGASAASPWNCA
jgi:hypothetical protein